MLVDMPYREGWGSGESKLEETDSIQSGAEYDFIYLFDIQFMHNTVYPYAFIIMICSDHSAGKWEME